MKPTFIRHRNVLCSSLFLNRSQQCFFFSSSIRYNHKNINNYLPSHITINNHGNNIDHQNKKPSSFGNYKVIQEEKLKSHPSPSSSSSDQSAAFAESTLQVSSSYSVPSFIQKPEYVDRPDGSPDVPDSILLKNPDTDIVFMRESCQLAKTILDLCAERLKIGVTTRDLDQFAFQEIIRHHAYPSPLKYLGYPASICTSINNVMVHGRPLENGDIINIDVTVFKSGYHGDSSRTFLVGEVDEQGRKLVETTKRALEEAIKICGPGVPFKEIGRVIESIAKKNGFFVNKDFVGHGIGTHFHEAPLILHHENTSKLKMQEGMCFTIEPILCEGSPKINHWQDGWTVVSKDEELFA